MWLRSVYGELRAFLARESVAQLFVAFSLAAATVAFLSSAFLDLIWEPIVTPASQPGAGEFVGPNVAGEFVLFGREFVSQQVLMTGFSLLVLLFIAAMIARRQASADDAFVECPHCLSDVPVGARVCAACTREIGNLSPDAA
jgi:large conductance mechanosensitive channel